MPTKKSSVRKLAAIMFTDIVGYTALMGRDTERALILVRTNRKIQKELIERYNGVWLKEMGDGSLSCFESALDSVNCAVEIQKAARENMDINLRIGIHLGDITMEGGEVYGDGVNVASRLESIADTGSIVISESIEQAIRGQSDIETLYLGESQLKNVDYGVRTYALQGEGLPRITAKKKNRRLIYIVLGLLLLLFGVLGFMQLSKSVGTSASQWVGNWQFDFHYDNDKTLVYSGLLNVSSGENMISTFEISLPKSSRKEKIVANITDVSSDLLAGTLTYSYGIGAGKLQESFILKKTDAKQFNGTGKCDAYCAEQTDGVTIKWSGQRVSSSK